MENTRKKTNRFIRTDIDKMRELKNEGLKFGAVVKENGAKTYLFNSDKYRKEIVELIKMYWGKHSLLALLLGEMKK